MSPTFGKTLFIFRRDLRLDDNSGLRSSLESSRAVFPCFILDPQQVGDHPYRSGNGFQFMLESLESLADEIRRFGGRLAILHGDPEVVVGRLISSLGIEAVFVNRDYTPYSIARDRRISEICSSHQIRFFQHADALLTEPEAVQKDDGLPYTVYTPFAKKARLQYVPEPVKISRTNFCIDAIGGELDFDVAKLLPVRNDQIFARGGAADGVHRLDRVGKLREYGTLRDLPAMEGTTGLSPHLKFGTISVRRVFHAIVTEFGTAHPLIGELYWRDFFTHIGFHFPHVFQGAFHSKYDSLVWRNDQGQFERWKAGETGFPIVDAGMRQLTQTGYMHNRVRMIVASFLTKDLQIDWRWGERFFAKHLVDYDPAANNGNWQWAASTGCDAAPYFRIFNPWVQQKRFDPEATYIRRWIPELRNLPAEVIHHLNTAEKTIARYPTPMVDHRVEAELAKQRFAILTQTAKGVV